MLQKFFDNFADEYKNKKVLVYGAGIVSYNIFLRYNLSNINIIGVIDKKFNNINNMKFFDLPTYPANEIDNIEYDILLIMLKNPECISETINSAKAKGRIVIPIVEEHIKFDKYNKIILVENGKEKLISEKELPAGFKISYTNKCRNNILKIELPHNFSNVVVQFTNVTDCSFEIGSTIHMLGSLFINFGEASNMHVKIGRNLSSCSTTILTNQIGSRIEIGDDCMFASDVKIVGADGHTIYDINTGKTINAQSSVCKIGNHVWLGEQCRIMKNANIPDNSIVGANAIVTKSFSEPNIILAGNPAKIIKHNVGWKRDVITSLEE